jgi:hypothetical protein
MFCHFSTKKLFQFHNVENGQTQVALAARGAKFFEMFFSVVKEKGNFV